MYEIVREKVFNYLYQVVVHKKFENIHDKLLVTRNLVLEAATSHGLRQLRTPQLADEYVMELFRRAISMRKDELDAAESLVILKQHKAWKL